MSEVNQFWLFWSIPVRDVKKRGAITIKGGQNDQNDQKCPLLINYLAFWPFLAIPVIPVQNRGAFNSRDVQDVQKCQFLSFLSFRTSIPSYVYIRILKN